jgi:hypothetical protein
MKIVIKGVVKQTSTWVEIVEVEAEETATLAECNEGVQEIRNLIARSFKSGNDGYMTFGDVVINIQSFAAIGISIE